MAGTEKNKMVRRRLRSAYTSSLISISLMLVVVGIAALLIVNARRVSEYFKENVQVTVIMKQGVDEVQASAFAEQALGRLRYVRQARIVSREEGTEELKAMLGEDFLSVFETSPVPVSVELSLYSGYVSADSLSFIIPELSAYPEVDEVDCQSSLVDALNANLAKISMILGVFVLLMLFISVVLINNTVRLSVFSRRFTVHTMKLVGATKGFIRKPFLRSALAQGLAASAIALLLISALLLALERSFPKLFELFSATTLAVSAAIVVACGILICVTSTYFIVGKLVSMDKDELYT